jgi:hypothetical protein
MKNYNNYYVMKICITSFHDYQSYRNEMQDGWMVNLKIILNMSENIKVYNLQNILQPYGAWGMLHFFIIPHVQSHCNNNVVVPRSFTARLIVGKTLICIH